MHMSDQVGMIFSDTGIGRKVGIGKASAVVPDSITPQSKFSRKRYISKVFLMFH